MQRYRLSVDAECSCEPLEPCDHGDWVSHSDAEAELSKLRERVAELESQVSAAREDSAKIRRVAIRDLQREHLDRTPEGTRLCYWTPGTRTMVITGTPDGEDHNCDSMGCQQEHVIERINVGELEASLSAPINTGSRGPHLLVHRTAWDQMRERVEFESARANGWELRYGELAEELEQAKARLTALEAPDTSNTCPQCYHGEPAMDGGPDGPTDECERCSGVVPVLRRRVARLGWELDEAMEKLADLALPPIVPDGWVVLQGNTGRWRVDAARTQTEEEWERCRIANLRALLWAIENDARPPHAADGKEGGE